jgi:hypothetical protein
LEPSVAHPPWPLQAFLPGLSPPPCPLQSFLPLQECFAGCCVLSCATSTPACDDCVAVCTPCPDTGCALRRAVVPPSRPANAAATARVCAEAFFIKEDLSWLGRAPCAPDIIGQGNPDFWRQIRSLPLRLIEWKSVQPVPNVGTCRVAKVTSFLRSVESAFGCPVFCRGIADRRLQILKSLLYWLGIAVIPILTFARGAVSSKTTLPLSTRTPNSLQRCARSTSTGASLHLA